MSKLKMSSLVFVSNNRYKLEEYRELLNIPNLEMLEVPTIDPQDLNLETLTRKKVESVRPILKNSPFFVEHTGLIIDAWKGLPGALTGQFMVTVGCDGICKMLQAYEGSERRARAKTVIGYYYDRNLQIFEGIVSGMIADRPRPRNSDAEDWDIIFIPDGEKRTFAEMGVTAKNRVSMRMKAALEFSKYLSDHFAADDRIADEELDTSAKEDIKRLMSYHRQRLQKLREQEALYGLSVDPSVKIEIEDIQTKMGELKAQLG